MKLFYTAIVAFGLSTGVAFSQQVMKVEPAGGALKTGEKVLVDNGRCPKGQVQEVTGGTRVGGSQENRAASAAGTSATAGSQERQRRCVARP
jgi:hypothetical protein